MVKIKEGLYTIEKGKIMDTIGLISDFFSKGKDNFPSFTTHLQNLDFENQVIVMKGITKRGVIENPNLVRFFFQSLDILYLRKFWIYLKKYFVKNEVPVRYY